MVTGRRSGLSQAKARIKRSFEVMLINTRQSTVSLAAQSAGPDSLKILSKMHEVHAC